MDHFLANIQLLQKERILKCDKRYKYYIVDEKNSLTVKTPGTYTIEGDSTKKYFSLLSVTEEVSGITLSGFKYPLNRAKINKRLHALY